MMLAFAEIRRARVWREEAIEYDRHDDRDERGRHCQPKLSVVGDQYASESGAQEEANKAWMKTSRWAYGERYMARDHAIEATYECGRSSVGSVGGNNNTGIIEQHLYDDKDDAARSADQLAETYAE